MCRALMEPTPVNGLLRGHAPRVAMLMVRAGIVSEEHDNSQALLGMLQCLRFATATVRTIGGPSSFGFLLGVKCKASYLKTTLKECSTTIEK